MTSSSVSIVRFRRDLRLEDNAAFAAACETGARVLPVYIHDAKNIRGGAASYLYLHHSLSALNNALDGALRCFVGDAETVLLRLAADTDAASVYWSRLYDKAHIAQDKRLKERFHDNGVTCESFNSALLFEPWELKTGSGTPYKVFTPFFRKGMLAQDPPAQPKKPATPDSFFRESLDGATDADGLNLLPAHPWHEGVAEYFTAGEDAAKELLIDFIENGLNGYKENRNFPGHPHSTSRLSAALHFGEISPRRIWHSVRGSAPYNDDIDCYLSEIGWREFSYSLFYHFPDMAEKPWKEKFNNMPWCDDADALTRWKRGQTGVPIIDAAMRQLWQTGYMHNRCRMIAASYLIKNLMIDWRKGEQWFFDTLIDADPASNAAGWQWVAGSGADAAPYFRIFNPETQSSRFDKDGDYIKRWVPELKRMPAKYIHAPQNAPDIILRNAKVILDKTYPRPLVDLKETRERALEALKTLG